MYAAGLGERWGSELASSAQCCCGLCSMHLPSLCLCCPTASLCNLLLAHVRLYFPLPLVLLLAAGREYVMPVRDIGRHGYKSDIKALCE